MLLRIHGDAGDLAEVHVIGHGERVGNRFERELRNRLGRRRKGRHRSENDSEKNASHTDLQEWKRESPKQTYAILTRSANPSSPRLVERGPSSIGTGEFAMFRFPELTAPLVAWR